MSPEFEIVCESPCNGCLFYSVCWLVDTESPFFERAEICIDYNFCSKNFICDFFDVTELFLTL